MASLNTNELKEILIKGWMTHDGMWFQGCLQACGIEQTNKINRGAVRDMAKIEVKRMAKALGVGRVDGFDDLQALLNGISHTLVADFMDITFSLSRPNQLYCQMKTCWAHDGIKRIGVIDQYECGVFDRISGWFEGLGIDYSVTPEVKECMMHSQGECHRTYTFDFGA